MKNIGEIVQFLESNWIYNFILPFLLIFCIIYGILQKIKIFDKKTTNMIISFCMGMIATSYGFYSGCLPAILKAVIISLVLILVFVILTSLFLENKKINYVAGLIIIISVFFFTMRDLKECRVPDFLSGYLPIIIIVALIIAAISIAFYFSKPTKQSEKKEIAEDDKKEKPIKDKKKKQDIDDDLKEDLEEITPKNKKKIKDLIGPETSS